MKKIGKAKRRYLMTCMDFAANNAEYERDIEEDYRRALARAAPPFVRAASAARRRRRDVVRDL